MCKLGIKLIFIAVILFITSMYVGESRYKYKEHSPEEQNFDDDEELDETRDVQVPRYIQRKFVKGTVRLINTTVYYYSLPVTIEHIKEDFFQLTAKYQKVKSTTLIIRLWMEFPDINYIEDMSNVYLIDLIPIIGSREMVGYESGCSLTTFFGYPRFPEDILELKYDITSLYKACQAMDASENFTKYKIRLYDVDEDYNVNLSKDEVDIFLIFKELDDVENVMDLLPNSKALEPIAYDSIKRQSFKIRSVNRHPKVANECSLIPSLFTFDITDWQNNVIAPRAFKLNICHGRCSFPFTSHVNYTNYAIIEAVGSMMYREMKNPYCIAKDLAPLFMVLFDESNKVILKYQKDMIPTSCICA